MRIVAGISRELDGGAAANVVAQRHAVQGPAAASSQEPAASRSQPPAAAGSSSGSQETNLVVIVAAVGGNACIRGADAKVVLEVDAPVAVHRSTLTMSAHVTDLVNTAQAIDGRPHQCA